MIAVCRFGGEVGGMPCLLTSRRLRASACSALPMHFQRSSTSVRAESSHSPSQQVAPLAKKTSWLPTWICFSLFSRQKLRFLENNMASGFDSSKQTAFLPPSEGYELRIVRAFELGHQHCPLREPR